MLLRLDYELHDQVATSDLFVALVQQIRKMTSTYHDRFYYRQFTVNIPLSSHDGSHRIEALH